MQKSASEESRYWLKGFSQQSLARVVSILSSFGAVTLAARYLGPTTYGDYATALAILGLGAAFSDLGVNAVVVKRHAGDPDRLIREVEVGLGLSIAYGVPIALGTAALGWLAYAAAAPGVSSLILIGCPYVAIQAVATSYLPILQMRSQFFLLAAADSLGALCVLLGSVIVVQGSLGPGWFAMINVLSALLRLGVFWLGSRHQRTIRARFDMTAWTSLAKEAAPLGAAALVAVIYFKVDTIMLSGLSTDSEVGIYSLAYRIVLSASAVGAAMYNASFYALSSRRGTEAFAGEAGAFVTRMIVISAPLSVGGAIFASSILNLVGGQEFSVGTLVLGLLMLTMIPTSVNTALSAVVISVSTGSRLLLLTGSSLVVNVVLNCVLIPAYGAAGAAIALLTSELAATLVVTFACRRLVHMSGQRALLGQVLLGLAALALVAAVSGSLPFLLRGVFSVIVYAAAVAPAFSGRRTSRHPLPLRMGASRVAEE